MNKQILLFAAALLCTSSFAQPHVSKLEKISDRFTSPDGEINITRLRWLPASHDFWVSEPQGIFVYNADDLASKKPVLTAEQIQQAGLYSQVENIVWSEDRNKLLIYTNSSRVWRVNSKGDYWYFDLKSGKGRKMGKAFPPLLCNSQNFQPEIKRSGMSVAIIFMPKTL